MSSMVLEGTKASSGQGIMLYAEQSINASDLITHGAHVTMATLSASLVRFVAEVPADSSEVSAEMDRWAERRWAEVLHDTASLALLEEMAKEALAEDAAGLTRDLDELL